ncbi:MAG: DMT family transporter [Chloroflexota bacterium]
MRGVTAAATVEGAADARTGSDTALPADRTGLAYTAAALAVFGWASLYPTAKLALQDVTPLMIAVARAGIACLALAAITCLRAGGMRAGWRGLRREVARGWRGPCALGLISFAGTSLLAMTAQQFLPAAVNGLLNNLSPLWLALYATVAGRARSAPLLLAGSTLAAAGVVAVLLGDALFGGTLVPPGAGLLGSAPGVASATGGAQSAVAQAESLTLPLLQGERGWRGTVWIGVGLSLCGSMLIAYSNIVARRVMRGRDPLATTAVAAGWAALPLLAALSLGVGGSLPAYAATSLETKGLLLWLGGMSTAFNFSLWFFALAHLPVTRIANFQYLIAPLGVVLAVAVLGEPAGPGLLAGTAAIVAGIALAQRGAEPAG